jgi:hypothetical protein
MRCSSIILTALEMVKVLFLLMRFVVRPQENCLVVERENRESAHKTLWRLASFTLWTISITALTHAAEMDNEQSHEERWFPQERLERW